MNINLNKVCDVIIAWSFYAVFFLVPLILAPWTYELFEFNKMMLIYGLTIVATAAWLIKIIINKKINFKPTPLLIPLVIFFASQLISTLISIEPHTSIWGYYSRFHGGLLSTISYLLLYFALVSNLNKNQVLLAIKALLASGFLVASYGILEHFGIDESRWIQDVRNRVFSTLGQPNWLAAWLCGLIPLTLALTQSLKLKSKKVALYYLLFTIYYICLLFTKSRSGILAFGFSYLVFWLLSGLRFIKYKKLLIKNFLLITVCLLLITAFIGTPYTPSLRQFFQKPTSQAPIESQPAAPLLISESGDIRKVVWDGALEVWRHWPTFGSGVETFAYSYYNFRPKEHNLLSEWDFLYNKAHNEYLNFLATTGIVGLTSYLLLISWTSIWMIKTIFKSKILTPGCGVGLLTGYLSILITNFFGFSIVAVALQFFLYPALLFALNQPVKEQIGKKKLSKQQLQTLKNESLKISIGQIASIIGVIVLTVVLLIRLTDLWLADRLFAEGKKLIKYQPLEAYVLLEKAAEISPNEALFHNYLAEAAAALVPSYNQQIEIAADEQTRALLTENRDFLIERALSESQQTLKLNSVHLNFYKTRTKVLISLTDADSNYNQEAIETLKQAIGLAPTDAKLYFNLGIVQNITNQEDEAIKTFEKAIELKPNYAKARHALATIYKNTNQLDKAAEQMAYILEQINPYDEQAKQALETWKK